MPMYKLVEYSDNYLKTSRHLQENYRDKPALNNVNVIIDFPGNGNDGTKEVKIMLPLKYRSSFWRAL